MKLKNITRRHKTYKFYRSQNDQFQKSLRYLPGEWMLSSLHTGKIINCSSDFSSLMGIDKSKLIDASLDVLKFDGNEQGWGLKTLDLELLSHSGRYEDVGVATPQNLAVVTDIWVNHVKQKNEIWALCLVTDKSHQRQLQGELIAKHQELRRAFAKLEKQTKELEEAKSQLKSKNKNISELSAQTRSTSALAIIGEITAELTHQLNNPLAAATGASRRLNKLYSKGKISELKPMLKLLTSSLHRLKQTVDEVRIIYRHSRVPVSPKVKIDVLEHIDATLALLEPRLETMEVRKVLPKTLPPIWGHKTLFQHVVVNLIDNAIDAASATGIVEVCAKADADYVQISICDNGPGIPPSLREKVFEAFYTSKEKGSGLGLAAVKRYVERDDAKISVSESNYGGAKFTICYQTPSPAERTT